MGITVAVAVKGRMKLLYVIVSLPTLPYMVSLLVLGVWSMRRKNALLQTRQDHGSR